jgi:orsellinic acid C2-O-methyltransferase
MSAPGGREASVLRSMMVGYEAAQVIYVAAKLGIADLIGDTRPTSRELAQRAGAHEGALHRMLLGLASLGILADLGDGRFELTERGRYLRSTTPGSLRRAALLAGERSYRAWGGLLHSVETGETAFQHVFGMRTFEYMAENPILAGIYNDAMAASAEVRAGAVVKAYDFSRFRSIADVGGGYGALLAAILAAHPSLRGVILERTSVAAGIHRRLGDAGVAGRYEVVAGDFFQTVPAGADAYLLSHIIHNWDDERCAVILNNCRAAMAATGTLLLVEQVLPARVEASPSAQRALMADLHMMVITGGRERTEAEYRALLAGSGFGLRRVVATPVDESVLEAAPV